MQGIQVRDYANTFQPPQPRSVSEGTANGMFAPPPNWNMHPFDPHQDTQQQPYIYPALNGGVPLDPRRVSLPVVQPTSGPPSAVDRGNTPSGTPPRLFDMSGLDFAGLDFVQNFTPGGYMGTHNEPAEMDLFWQNFDNQPLQQPFGALAENSGFTGFGNQG